tara:strand:+ start:20485 stop:20850 length:366 start_codon:yes stop_codon:yes gene_type:complete
MTNRFALFPSPEEAGYEKARVLLKKIERASTFEVKIFEVSEQDLVNAADWLTKPIEARGVAAFFEQHDCLEMVRSMSSYLYHKEPLNFENFSILLLTKDREKLINVVPESILLHGVEALIR